MNQLPIDAQVKSGTGNRWSLVPALTLAGLLSVIWTQGFIWFPSIVSVKSEIPFVLLASVSFGLSLGAVLWLYGLIRTWKALTAAVGVIVAAHLFEEFADRYVVTGLRDYVDIPVLGSIVPATVLTSSAVAFILIVTLLKLARTKLKIGWFLLLSIMSSLLAGLTVGVIDGMQRGAWFSFWTGNALGLLWQLVLALFISIALVLGQVDFPSRLVTVSAGYPRTSFIRRFGVFGVLLVFFVVTGAWCHSTQVRYGKRNLELQARVK
jgi:hypothetical protein